MQPSDSLASFGRGYGSPRRWPTSWDRCFSADLLGDQRVHLQTRWLRRSITGSPSDRNSRGETWASRVTGPSSSCVLWCNTPPDSTLSSPLLLFEKIYGLVVIAFAKNRTLGIRNEHSFRSQVPTAHTLACLRFADLVTETVARLATGSGGLTPGRTGFAPAGRHSEVSWSHRIPPIPIDQQKPGRTVCPTPPQDRSVPTLRSSEPPAAGQRGGAYQMGDV
jgi:hypothetical protein